MTSRLHLRVPALLFTCFAALPASATAAELKQKTLEAFNHYVELSASRLSCDVRSAESFLWMDQLPDERRQAVATQLLQGRVVVERLETREAGRRILIPHGLVHHWIGLAFIPGVSLAQTRALLQDYDHHQDFYQPSVQVSRLLRRDGNDFKVFLRLYRKAMVTAVYNAQFDIRYLPVDSTRECSRSFSTRIAEVENPGKPDEHEKPVGNDRGYLWRVNTYWRFEQKDGGVYVQVEFISLSRSVPAIFAWLVNPYLKNIPRQYLADLLEATRRSLTTRTDTVSYQTPRREIRGPN